MPLASGARLGSYEIVGTESEKGPRAYLTDVSGAQPRAITPEGITYAVEALALSPDGTRVVLRSPDDRVMLYPLAAGEPVAVNGLNADEMPTGWTGDSRALFLTEGSIRRAAGARS